MLVKVQEKWNTKSVDCIKCKTLIPQGQSICPNCGTNLVSTPVSFPQPIPTSPTSTPLTSTAPLYSQPQVSPGGSKNALAIILLFFFWPAGLIVMWKYTNWPKKVKWLTTVVLVILIIITVYLGMLAAQKIQKENKEQTKKVSMQSTPMPSKLISDLPPVPDGFSWERCFWESYLLLPNGWNFKEVFEPNGNTCTITKKKFGQEDFLSTGLYVTTMENISKQYNKKPSEFAKSTLETIGTTGDAGEVLEATEIIETNDGPFKIFYRYTIIIPSKTTSEQKEYISIVANDAKDSAFAVTFESPKENWDVDWKIGEIIINNLHLDPNFEGVLPKE